MRVLHAAAMRERSSGIMNQMKWEQDAAKELGLSWSVRVFLPKDYSHEPNEIIQTAKKMNHEYSFLGFRKEYYEWLLSQEKLTDCFLLRYNSFDFQQLEFIKKVKKPVFLIHHTLELPELKAGNTIKSKIQYLLELFIGKHSIRAAKGIIAVTNEIFDYENERSGNIFKDKIIYANGIKFSENSDQILDKRGSVPEIVFIASYFYDWHGLDLLLINLKNNNEQFTLHIIGEVSETDKILAQRDERVILHGHLNNDQINEILQKSWVGLASFALDRKNMKEACTLKVREYLKNGLPVYASYKEVFPIDFSYYRNGIPDFDEIINYAKSFNDVSREEISNESKEYIDKKLILKKLYEKLLYDM